MCCSNNFFLLTFGSAYLLSNEKGFTSTFFFPVLAGKAGLINDGTGCALNSIGTYSFIGLFFPLDILGVTGLVGGLVDFFIDTFDLPVFGAGAALNLYFFILTTPTFSISAKDLTFVGGLFLFRILSRRMNSGV